MATLREILGDAYREDITVSEIEAALASKKIADLSGGQYVSLSKHNSIVNGLTAERDDFKTKYTSTLTEAQKAEQESLEREARYKQIEMQNSVYRYTDKLSATIKDKAILTEIATLMAEGKFDEAIDKQNAYIATANAEAEKQIRDELMKHNPQATPQTGTATYKSKAEILAIKDTAERQKAIADNINLFQ